MRDWNTRKLPYNSASQSWLGKHPEPETAETEDSRTVRAVQLGFLPSPEKGKGPGPEEPETEALVQPSERQPAITTGDTAHTSAPGTRSGGRLT